MSEPEQEGTADVRDDRTPIGDAGNCPHCGSTQRMPDQYVYAIGTLDVRFPSVAVEREFTQKERMAGKASGVDTRAQRIHRVLSEYHHLARNVCYLLSVGSVPAYKLVPVSAAVGNDLVEAVASMGEPTVRSIVIGTRIGNSAPQSCGGVIVPVVACDQVYTFSLEEWRKGLADTASEPLESLKISADTFKSVANEVFVQVTSSMENVGGLDTHRALNYALVQHPGFFLAIAERAEDSVLDRIETRPVASSPSRSQVAVILTFVKRATGVPERLFCVVDVSERWPFVVSTSAIGTGPLAMLPFVENSVLGIAI